VQLTCKQAADKANVTPAYIRMLFHDGTLTGRRFGDRLLLIDEKSLKGFRRKEGMGRPKKTG
jgi:excisionase family DNA binding protein